MLIYNYILIKNYKYIIYTYIYINYKSLPFPYPQKNITD